MEVTVKGAKFEVKDLNEHIQRHWVAGNFYEAHGNGLLAYLKRNNYSGRCLDIGASIGNHTVYFKKMLGCDVISIEPVKSSFKHLKKNCELNKIDVELHNIALGNRTGKVSMKSFSGEKYNVGMFQVVEGKDTKIDKLDNVVEGQFDFIKIDVEHFNIPLLKGAEATLKAQDKCHVFIECETTQILKETSIIMRSYGYKMVKGVKLNHTPTYLFTK